MLSTGALAAASVRVASSIVPEGLERLLAASAIGATAAVCEALALGLADLGSSPIALTAAAVVSWLGVRATFPAPGTAVLAELASWWDRSDARSRALAGALAGLLLAWAAWNVHRPDVGVDGAYYHLPEIAIWIEAGTPGSVEPVHSWLEVGSYPVTNEVLLSWAMGISRGMVPQSVLSVALLAILIAGGVVGMRALRVPPLVRGLAIATLLSVPIAVLQVNGPNADVPALAWLVCAGGLGAAARSRPALLAPMLLAAGLSVGTKTTTLPLASALVAVALTVNRRQLAAIRGPLIAAAVAATAAGGFWYLRTFVSHGSPFWPFAAAPWGDPVPPLFDSYHSLLSEPRATLTGKLDDYVTVLSGACLVAAAALYLAVRSRRGVLLACAVLLVASTVLWACAPTSGVSDYGFLSAQVSQTRYLLPVVALALLTLGLCSRAGAGAERATTIVLAAALGWNLVQVATGDFPGAVSVAWLATGAAAGGVAAALIPGFGARVAAGLRRPATRLAALVAIAALTAGLIAAGASGYLARYESNTEHFDSPLLRWFDRRGLEDDERPIFMTPELAGAVAGESFQRSLELIELDTPCAEVAALRERGWVILRRARIYRERLGYTAGGCLQGAEPRHLVGIYRVYAPSS